MIYPVISILLLIVVQIKPVTPYRRYDKVFGWVQLRCHSIKLFYFRDPDRNLIEVSNNV